MGDKKYRVWLSSLPGIGSRKSAQLIQYFSGAKPIFSATEQALIDCHLLIEKDIKIIIENRNIEKIDRYMDKLKERGISILLPEEEAYPYLLKNIYDPPAVLYVMGTLCSDDINAVAVVGSRKCSDYGRKMAFKLSQELAELGVTIVSGMAIGIDSYAHRGALEGNGRTIAVMGCGLGKLYPTSNQQLAEQILKHGAIVSEYPLGMPALPGNFPARNRIISGLSQGVLVVEAAERSGSLITSDFALEQGREVFAVPGNINLTSSEGTNNLIKNGAVLTRNVEDIIAELQLELKQKETYQNSDMDETPNEIQQTILTIIANDPCSLDELAERTGISAKDLLSNLSILEIEGKIGMEKNKYLKEF